MRLRSTKEDQLSGPFSFEIREPGIKSVVYMDYFFSNWVKFTFSLWLMGHLMLTSSHFVRQASEISRRDLARDQSFRLGGMRLMSKAWELGGII